MAVRGFAAHRFPWVGAAEELSQARYLFDLQARGEVARLISLHLSALPVHELRLMLPFDLPPVPVARTGQLRARLLSRVQWLYAEPWCTGDPAQNMHIQGIRCEKACRE